MPSVEIICIGQRRPLPFKRVSFRVYAENRLISHRSPSPLFQADFDKLRGCIYHLCHHSNVAYTAGGLLTEWWDIIHFKPHYVRTVHRLMTRLLRASPEHRIIFTSDYQFGPGPRRYLQPMRSHQFWVLHGAKRIRTDALYTIVP